MKPTFLRSASLFAALFGATPAFAAGMPTPINYYEILLERLHVPSKWEPTVGSLLCLLIIIAIGVMYKAAVARDTATSTPDGKFGIRFLVEGIMEFVWGIAKDNTHDKARAFYPLLAALFVSILINNVSGLIPGFPPSTESMANNVAMGLIVFIVYNYAGFKETGAGYIKHFLGPVALIAPLFFVIEIVSHSARPLSLGLRLTANIFADHTLLGVFTGLTYVGVPALLLFFGLLVAVVQAFVFTLLTGIYISMAIAHDH